MRERKQSDLADRTIAWALVALVGLLPLITYPAIFEHISPRITNFAVLDTATVFDVFVTRKFQFLLLLGGLILLLFAYRSTQKRFELQPDPMHGPILLLAALILVSLLLSPYKSLAVAGLDKYNRMGTVTYLIDLGLFLAALHSDALRRMPRALLYALAPFAAINAALTTLYFYGINLMESPAIQNFFYPPGKITLTAGGALITTLGNQNYSAGLGGVLTAVFITAALLDQERRHQSAWLLLGLLSFATTVASLSASGYMAFYVALPFIGLAAWRYGSKGQVLRNGLIAAVGATLIFAVFTAYNPRVLTEARSPFAEAYGLLSRGDGAAGEAGEAGGAATGAPGAPAGEPSLVPEIPQALRSGGSGRVHIWRHSIRLMLERPLFGWGLDTIAYTFPQNDVSGGNLEVTVKPHNIFLDYGYGAGIPAMLAFMAAMAIALWRLVVRRLPEGESGMIMAAVGVGVVAFLAQGLVNDFVLGASTLLWVWVGAMVKGRESA